MNRCFLALVAGLVLECSLPALPAAAAMDLSTMDCSKSSAMMMKMPDSSAMPAMSASATTDQAFDGMSHMMMQHAAMMAGMELKCGKDTKSRAAAAKLLEQLDADGIADAKDILKEYNH